MIARGLHPAVLQLVAWQGRGRIRRMWKRFLLPRRLVLSALAILLAIAWLGNAALTIWLREAASPEMLRALVSFGFTIYALWHVAKVAFFRPAEPLDWDIGERELLSACPLDPSDLLAYKVAAVTATTLLKAGVFAVLLLPDVSNLPLALAGIVLGMLLLELLRMGLEIVTASMNRPSYLVYRVLVLGTLIVLGGGCAGLVMQHGLLESDLAIGQGVLSRLAQLVLVLNASAASWISVPFRPFVDLIVARGSWIGLSCSLMLAVVMVLSLGAAVFWLFPAMNRQMARRERQRFRPQQPPCSEERLPSTPMQHLPAAPGLGGAGIVAWRQLIGVRRQVGGLLTAMLVPAILALLPSHVVAETPIAFLSTAGALAFYTFLLLPTALRFDFRRDLDRLVTLKALPLTPGSVVLGQLAAPVLVTVAFQATVLAVAAAARSVSVPFYLGTLVALVPMNVLVFALDNLIFLLFPYRIRQEGLEIFLRTILTFTGKGLLFTLGLAALSAWGFGAGFLVRLMSRKMGVAVNSHLVFAIGIFVGLAALAAAAVFLLRRVYRRLNAVEDIPR